MAAKPEDYKVGELFKKNPDKPKQEAIRGGDPSRRDDIRTEQLTKKGSKAILRDKKTGGILVRKKNNKQVRPFRDEKPFKKWNEKPIKGKQISPRYKSDWVDGDEELEYDNNQTKFSGETSGYVEKPKYNEEELQKAIDVEVDELIKTPKPKKPEYILKSKYDLLQLKLDVAIDKITLLESDLNTALSQIETLNSTISELELNIDLAKLQEASAQNETQVANDRFATLLGDFQNSIVNGSKEGIERVSLNAQVRGLQAQKKTLQQLLESQKDLVKALQQQAENQAATTAAIAATQQSTAAASAAAGGGKTQGEAGYNVLNRKSDDYDFEYRSNRKSNGWANGTSLELLNLDDEKDVTWSITVKKKSGGHSSPWLGFSSTSGTLPKRSGTTPGKQTITAKKIRNINSPKGRRKVFKDEATLKIGGKSFKLQGQFYRKLRSGGSGN